MRYLKAPICITMVMVACAITLGTSYGAVKPSAARPPFNPPPPFVSGTSQLAGPCTYAELQGFEIGQPFVLNDPRSGLILYVESDGRHIAAITRDGKMRWHRNLFDDPRLPGLFPAPIERPAKAVREWQQSYIAHEAIDRIGIETDCVLRLRNQGHDPARFRGHYIRAGSGTHITWLLDAKTGDFQLENIY
jgi:hypothetical protein